MIARRVLLADSDALARWPMAERLRAAGFDVVEARTAADAIAHALQGLDVAIVDDAMADDDGANVLESLYCIDPDLTSVALRHDVAAEPASDQPHAVFESIARPVALDAVARVVTRGIEVTRLRRDLRALRDASAPITIVGAAPVMDRVRALVGRYAISPPSSSVLITGESGTGKRTVARCIHAAGARAASPILVVACTAMPEDALERALFGADGEGGHLRISGALETARDGTLVLTGVDMLPLSLQVRLLQSIEARTFRRAGATTDVATEVRVIATSAVDLEERVRAGSFRGDLFYRLSGLRVDLPPLRARREDVPMLARYFAAQAAREFDQREPADVRAEGDSLADYPWPGNVRELRSTVERAVLSGLRDADGVIDVAHALARPSSGGDALHDGAFVLPAAGVNLEDVERGLVAQALARTGGNQTKAAALLSIHRDQIRYRIEKFGLRSQGAWRDSS